MKKTGILIHYLLKEILIEIVEKKGKSFSSSFTIDRVELDGLEYLKIGIKDLNLDNLCSLGSSIFYNIHTWNDNINKKIQLRDSTTVLGEKYFNGSKEEKETMNEKDNAMKINFLTDFENNFVHLIKSLNDKYNYSEKVLTDSTFNSFINCDHGIYDVADNYNERYKTDFNIYKIIDDDGLNFAEINISNATIIDVLCLGYLTCQDDVIKMNDHKYKKN